jgi:hypothetical protein
MGILHCALAPADICDLRFQAVSTQEIAKIGGIAGIAGIAGIERQRHEGYLIGDNW